MPCGYEAKRCWISDETLVGYRGPAERERESWIRMLRMVDSLTVKRSSYMSNRTTEVQLEHDSSPETRHGCTTPGIAPPDRDAGGSGGRNEFRVRCARAPRGLPILERAFPPTRAIRVGRRARVADVRRLAQRTVLFGLTLCALLSFGAMSSAAETGVRLDGPRTQGSLLRGRVPPGSTVEYEGDAVRVSKDGWFLVGFGRDAPPEAELVVVHPDGRRERRVLKVERREYDIQRIDGLPPGKVTPRSEEDLARIRADVRMVKQARAIDDPRADFLSGFRWPTRGRISGVYGSQRILNGEPRRPHFGIDIAAPTGTKVVAPADGVVTLVHPDMFFSGGTMIVDHGHGLSSAFLHLSRILVEKGQRVVQGQPIAEVGSTGRSTGPHVDWRINLFDRRLDPAFLVGPMPK